MKRILLIVALLIAGATAQSQVLITLLLGDKLNSDNLEFGLEGGLNWSSISGMETNNLSRNFNLGFYFDLRIKNQWWFYTGVLVKSNLGVDKLTDTDLIKLGATKYTDIDGVPLMGDYSHQMKTFLVPALLKYKFKNHFYTEFGPQFGLVYKSWIEFQSDVDGKDAIIKEYNRDKVNRIDAGLMLGAGYTLLKGTGWTIGAKYYYGFVNTYKGIPGTKNSSIFLKLNIPIGAGEPTKKE